MGKLIDFNYIERRREYRYSVYDYNLMLPDGLLYTRSFIVIKNKLNSIIRFTDLHKYIALFDGRIFVPITANAKKKMQNVCMMLNYILVDNYDVFKIDHVFNITKEALESFFRDYALNKSSRGEYRSQKVIKECVQSIVDFMGKLKSVFGDEVLIKNTELYSKKVTSGMKGKLVNKIIPAFQVRGVKTCSTVFRDLPTKVFNILLNLAFRYMPEIAFAMCLQAFAGLRAGEVFNVRRRNCVYGPGIIFTKIEGRIVKAEIDLTAELPMRSDGIICGKIKKERKQAVYPPFLNAFISAYDRHMQYLQNKEYEEEYAPMFINSYGMAMTYSSYLERFKKLVNKYLKPTLIASQDPECRIYGQLLCENNLGTHALRHWYSVQLVLHGEDVAQIQFWRGDSNPESALLYLRNKGDLLKELHQANNDLIEILMEYGESFVNE